MITDALEAFATALPDRGRLAGLDVGSRTIGIGLCDAQWTIASPAETRLRTRFQQDAAWLLALAGRERLTGLVVGLPLNLDGSQSAQTQSVRAFCRNLEKLTDLPMLLWDERWSTMAVEKAMIAQDVSRSKRDARIDKAAAAYILQGAIDALSRF